MELFRRREGKRGRFLPAVLTAVAAAAILVGSGVLVPQPAQGQNNGKDGKKPAPAATSAAAADLDKDYYLLDAFWTTGHISTGVGGYPGLVVPYLAPAGRNPYTQKDWIGIYQKGREALDSPIYWDWVCPNDEAKCKSFGAAALGVGNSLMESGKTYTIAYWRDESNWPGTQATRVATIDFVVPW
jgi:hypothetical protein